MAGRYATPDFAAGDTTQPLFPIDAQEQPTRMQTLRFELDRDHIELNQLLKLTGVCDSGGAGKHLVATGAVHVDGAVELRKTCKIRNGQRVSVGDVVIDVVAV